MATIKLTYLDYKGRAELLRFILSQAGVEFEDRRLKPEQWAEEMPGKLNYNSRPQGSWLLFIPGTEFGTPVLECEGTVLKTNGTIAKFLASKYSEIQL